MSRVNRPRAFVFAVLALVGVVAGSGCTAEVVVGPEPFAYVADLQVTWGINGVDDPRLCDVFGIDEWVVEVAGPESRGINLDCRGSNWNSESDFFSMTEGNYLVSVHAVGFGATLATQSVSYDLFDDGSVQPVYFDFLPDDFGAPF